MTREKLQTKLEEHGYKKHSIDSILSGRRRPNGDMRELMKKKNRIPTHIWGKDIKSYIQPNTTNKTANKSMAEA